MKKFLPLAIVTLFAIFASIGYLLASGISKNNHSTTRTQNTETPEILAQENYLILLVDDFNAKKPALLSIWGVLSSSSPDSSLFFVPLFPTASLSTNEQLTSLFKLQRNKSLTASSLRRYSRVFDLEIASYFIIDNTSYLIFASDAGIDELGVLPNTPATNEEINLVRNSTSKYFSNICDLFFTGAANSFTSKIDWGNISQNQVISNLSTEEILSLIDQLNSQSTINTCEVAYP